MNEQAAWSQLQTAKAKHDQLGKHAIRASHLYGYHSAQATRYRQAWLKQGPVRTAANATWRDLFLARQREELESG